MTQFTKYYPTQEAMKQNPIFPSTFLAVFLGFDSIAQGDRATEATDLRDLGWPLSAKDSAIFSRLSPGESSFVDGSVYRRD